MHFWVIFGGFEEEEVRIRIKNVKGACRSRILVSFLTRLRYQASNLTISCLVVVLGCFMWHFDSIVKTSCVLVVSIHKSCPF